MGAIVFILVFVIIFLDLLQKLSVTKGCNSLVYGIIAPHIFIIYYLLNSSSFILKFNDFSKNLLYIGIFVYFVYVLVRISVIPNIKKECNNFRVGVQYDGGTILQIALESILIQIPIYAFEIFVIIKGYIGYEFIIADIVISIIFLFSLLINGATRVLVCCRRLGIVKRIIIYLFLWTPIINLFLIEYMISKVNEEYMHTCDFENLQSIRKESDMCNTKYPLLMLHGIGFKDVNYVNYWGRIPKALIKYGARIYYGHQEAWGTVENNAFEVRDKIYQIMRENNCDKVNIIAHSKGGLDARYLISCLNMGDHVASLTTISTPHRGSEVMNLLVKLPDKLYRSVSNFIDRTYKKLGDKSPDCYVSSRQLLPEYCMEFNKRVLDDKRVFYQSYTSSMKSMFSDSLLGIPYALMKIMGVSENDGLVSVDSSKWGVFRGVYRNKYRRGISHADIIDLKREDYKKYDPIETFVQIVSDLKKNGF